MRTYSPRAKSRTIEAFLLISVCCAVAACGGDDKAEAKPAAVQAGSSAPGTVKLADHTAGLACTSSKECGGGNCVTEFPGIAVLGTSAQPAPGGYCSLACRVSADCGAGGSCVGALGGAPGQCFAECARASDCREGYFCADFLGQPLNAADGASGSGGTCQVAPPTDKLTGTTVGSMCSADEDCRGGRCRTMDELRTVYPGGYCTGRCLVSSDCGENGWCSGSIAGITGTCFRSCGSDSDCGREGYRCRTVTGTDTKRCVPGSEPLPDNTVGKACTQDADCGGRASSCATELSPPFTGNDIPLPGGYCTASCVEDVDCGSGGSCVSEFRAVAQGLSGGCYKTCSADGDCRSGYHCLAPRNLGGSVSEQPSICAPIIATDADAGM